MHRPVYCGVALVLAALCLTPRGARAQEYGSGWWTEPDPAAPVAPIDSGGRWTARYATGGEDQLATKITAFLIAAAYHPPACGPCRDLPPELFTAPHVIGNAMVDRKPLGRTVVFSGRVWNVKRSAGRVGPGPNFYSDTPEDVRVDEQGRLHMRIAHRNGAWYCSELYTADPLGYGRYLFQLASPVEALDRSVVLGLFTWDDLSADAAARHNREIDIEVSRWGDPAALNGQYVVQPGDQAGRLRRFGLPPSGDATTQAFDWRADGIDFETSRGWQAMPAPPAMRLQAWRYSGAGIPPPGRGSAHINLWLYRGRPPADGKDVEVVLERFDYVP